MRWKKITDKNPSASLFEGKFRLPANLRAIFARLGKPRRKAEEESRRGKWS
jgi:hypothetical protein